MFKIIVCMPDGDETYLMSPVVPNVGDEITITDDKHVYIVQSGMTYKYNKPNTDSGVKVLSHVWLRVEKG